MDPEQIDRLPLKMTTSLIRLGTLQIPQIL